uniref:Wnt inhibitory factor 1 n=1 Tax=Timema tahoe TaxID=61484 RepID=A0A7R9IC63_9NEOP|nr:unnamed protein product [Timema tahoe]
MPGKILNQEVAYVNFTWKSGVKKYYYHFDRLQSFDENILESPVISIKTKGRVPRRPKVFSVLLPCSGNSSGIAMFSIGLLLETRKGRALPGTPLRLRLRKECAQRGPDPECDKRCANGGWCNHDKICQCPEGYMGQYCKTALCYPQCMNGGSCTSPGGYVQRNASMEANVSRKISVNVQKDIMDYVASFCIIPCLNGGKCRGVNKCRCPAGFRGDHCEIGRRVPQRSPCTKSCQHGTCKADICVCDLGWFGRLCHQSMSHKIILLPNSAFTNYINQI